MKVFVVYGLEAQSPLFKNGFNHQKIQAWHTPNHNRRTHTAISKYLCPAPAMENQRYTLLHISWPAEQSKVCAWKSANCQMLIEDG